MIHKSSIILLAGLVFVAYQIGNSLLIKFIWILSGIIFIFPTIDNYLDIVLKKPLFTLSLVINFVILAIFYYTIFSPYALVYKAISKIKTYGKRDYTNFVDRNHGYIKNDLIRTF